MNRVRDNSAATLEDILNQRRLRVTPCISNIDNERYPTIVKDSLQGVLCVRGRSKKKRSGTYAASLDYFCDALL